MNFTHYFNDVERLTNKYLKAVGQSKNFLKDYGELSDLRNATAGSCCQILGCIRHGLALGRRSKVEITVEDSAHVF
jgi:hypothetical protein